MKRAAALAAAIAFTLTSPVHAHAADGPAAPIPVVAQPNDPDQNGIAPSAYRGRYFRAQLEAFRKCIAQREGRGQYGVTGSGGHYEGTYQMTDALAIGAGWMMRDELRHLFGATVGTEIARMLRATPAHLWDRFYQDMAFWTILNWKHDLAGTNHWNGGRFACWPGMTAYGGAR